MKKNYACMAALFGACFFCCMPNTRAEAAGPKVTLGVGVGFAPDYEGSEDYTAVPVFSGKAAWDSGRYLSFVGMDDVSVRGAELKANVVSLPYWEMGPVIRYRPERDDVDNAKVDKLDKIDAAVEGGGFLSFVYMGWNATITGVTDISNEHDGTLFRLSAGYAAQLTDRFRMSVDWFMNWASSSYMDTYFGVNAANSLRSGLRRYNASSSGWKDTGLGLTGDYRLQRNWSIAGMLGYTRLIRTADGSPLVKDEGNDKQYFGNLSLNYHF